MWHIDVYSFHETFSSLFWMDAYPDNFKNGPPCCPTWKVTPHSTHIAFVVGLMLGGI